MLAEFSEKIAAQPHISAIRRGLLINMPLMVIGSFAIMLNNLPLLWYHQGMDTLVGPHWENFGTAISNGSFGIMSLLLVLSISYFLAESHGLAKKGVVNPVITSLISLACLVILMQPIANEQSLGLPFTWMGKAGLFLATISALTSTEIFLRISSINKLQINNFCDEADPAISQALASIIPAAITLVLFASLKLIILTYGVGDIHQFIYDFIKNFFLGLENTLRTAILYDVLRNLFWFVGMHGANVLEPVAREVYVVAEKINMGIMQSGGQPTQIITQTFFSTFTDIGGAGATFGLLMALLLVSFKDNTAWLAKLSILPSLFNINEILIFGLPIAFNPIYLLPFILAPVVLVLTSWLAIATGIVPVITNAINWTTPPFLSGYLATGSWRGAALQAFNIFLSTLIYLPFVKLAKKQKYLEIKRGLDKLLTYVECIDTCAHKHVLNRRDNVGHLGRVLGYDLQEALSQNELVLEYQPQIAYDGKVIGVEALLRWPHKVFGRIPPPVIIAIAEETGLIQEVGNWVFSKACRQLREWKDIGIVNIRMSVNVSVLQLYHGKTAGNILEQIRLNGLSPQDIEIEITEKIALNSDGRIITNLSKLNESGVRIAIDDFGTGHSSLTYIKNFPVDTLKIDRSLSKDVIDNRACQEIITTIIKLCSCFHIEVIAEYVETQEQRDKLRELGCSQYQGYLYSPALSAEEAGAYIKKLNKR